MVQNPFQYIEKYFGADGEVNSFILDSLYLNIEGKKKYIQEMIKNHYSKFNSLPLIEFSDTFIDKSQLLYRIKTKEFPSKIVLEAMTNKHTPTINDMLSQARSLTSFGYNSLLAQPKTVLPYTTECLTEFNNIWFYIEQDVNYLDVLRERMSNERAYSDKLLLDGFSISTNKNKFISNTSQELIKYYKKSSQDSIGVQKSIDILINQHIKEAFNILKSDYNNYLEDNICERIDSMIEKKNILSFYYPFSVNPNQVKAAIRHLINAKLIDEDTPYESFVDFFSKKDMSGNKINWTGGKSALFSFIQTLISSKAITFPSKTHWNITANCFTLNLSTLNKGDLSSQKHIKNEEIRRAINSFFSHFYKLETKQL